MQDERYLLTLQGVSPLVFNSNAALLSGGEDKGRDPAAYEREHFREKAYSDGNGGLVIPARAIKKALINACKFLPEKPKGVSFKSFGPFIEAATIVPQDAQLSAGVKDLKALTLVVNLDPSKGNKGPRGPRTRPMLVPPWTATCELVVFDPILKQDVIERIVDRAGKQVGFCDGRSIDFGRCLVTVKKL